MRNHNLAQAIVAKLLAHAGVLSITVFSFCASDLSPQELRYLAIETTVALQADAQTAEYDFKVQPQDQSLVLTGEVPTEPMRVLAERIAQVACRNYSVEIVNKIRVKTGEDQGIASEPAEPTALDQEQMEKFGQLLAAEFPDLADMITVNFDLQPMPTIVLEGLIPSYEQKLEISTFARRHYRQLPVLNNLQVRRREVGGKTVYAVSPRDLNTVIVDKRSADTVESEVAVRAPRPTDEVLAETLAAVLKDDPVIHVALIKLRVQDGVVWASGKVAGMGQRNRALRLLEEQPGVRYVVDQLIFTPANPDASDSKIEVVEQKDATFQVRRALIRRMPALSGSRIEVVDRTVVITPATDKPFAQAEINALEARLARLPEMKGYTIVVRPKLSVSDPRIR
jgi:osmotically-inducible protein OsmY